MKNKEIIPSPHLLYLLCSSPFLFVSYLSLYQYKVKTMLLQLVSVIYCIILGCRKTKHHTYYYFFTIVLSVFLHLPDKGFFA